MLKLQIKSRILAPLFLITTQGCFVQNVEAGDGGDSPAETDALLEKVFRGELQPNVRHTYSVDMLWDKTLWGDAVTKKNGAIYKKLETLRRHFGEPEARKLTTSTQRSSDGSIEKGKNFYFQTRPLLPEEYGALRDVLQHLQRAYRVVDSVFVMRPPQVILTFDNSLRDPEIMRPMLQKISSEIGATTSDYSLSLIDRSTNIRFKPDAHYRIEFFVPDWSPRRIARAQGVFKRITPRLELKQKQSE